MKSKSSVTVACFLPGRAKDLSAPLCMLFLWVQCYIKWYRFRIYSQVLNVLGILKANTSK